MPDAIVVLFFKGIHLFKIVTYLLLTRNILSTKTFTSFTSDSLKLELLRHNKGTTREHTG